MDPQITLTCCCSSILFLSSNVYLVQGLYGMSKNCGKRWMFEVTREQSFFKRGTGWSTSIEWRFPWFLTLHVQAMFSVYEDVKHPESSWFLWPFGPQVTFSPSLSGSPCSLVSIRLCPSYDPR
uniref:Uncharacterized protein n=1 Tax=Opuntia streptacantha TaxID=393608 RepID=A0A7C9FAJ7_OPUST